jgi:hypothetical protein
VPRGDGAGVGGRDNFKQAEMKEEAIIIIIRINLSLIQQNTKRCQKLHIYVDLNEMEKHGG